MVSLKRKHFNLTLISVPVLIIMLLAQGCAGPKSGDVSTGEKKAITADRSDDKPVAESFEIKPTTETAWFYNAVKGADRVAIFEPGSGLTEAQEDILLSSFNANDPVFNNIMYAVTSATTGGEP